jgi:hypothetical protein
LFLVIFGCSAPPPPPPPPPPAPVDTFDELAWWRALPPCVQKNLLEETRGAAPTQEAEVAPVLAVTKLTHLVCPSLDSLEWIRPLTRLQRLRVRPKGADLAPLGELVHLENLDLHDKTLTAWSEALTLPALRELQLQSSVSDLSFLSRYPKLETLSLAPEGPADLTPLRGLSLTSLRLRGRQVKLEPLTGMTHLESLVLSDLPLDQLAPLATLTGLRELELRAPLDGKIDLPSLSKLPLTRLSLGGDLVSPELLGQMKTLRELDIASTDLRSLEVLAGLELERLHVEDDVISAKELEAYQAAHPKTEVSVTGE